MITSVELCSTGDWLIRTSFLVFCIIIIALADVYIVKLDKIKS